MKQIVIEEVQQPNGVVWFRLGMSEGNSSDKCVAMHYKMFKNAYEKVILRDCKGFKWADGKLYFHNFEKADFARLMIEARLVAKKLMNAK